MNCTLRQDIPTSTHAFTTATTTTHTTETTDPASDNNAGKIGISNKGQVSDTGKAILGEVVGAKPGSLVDGVQDTAALDVGGLEHGGLTQTVGSEVVPPGARGDGAVLLVVGVEGRETRVRLLEADAGKGGSVTRSLLVGSAEIVVAVVVPGFLEALGGVVTPVLEELRDDFRHAEDGVEVGDGDNTLVLGVSGWGKKSAVLNDVGARAGDEAVLERRDTRGGSGQLPPGLLPAGAATLPLKQPSGGESSPVSTQPKGNRFAGSWLPAISAHLSDRVELQTLLQQLADTLVTTRDVVEVLAVLGLGDTSLLGTVRKVQNTVAGSQTLPVANVVDVDLTSVAGQSLGEAVDVRATGTKEVLPDKQIRRELRVVPSIASNIVTPLMPVDVVGVHEVTVVQEAVPASLLNLVLVVLDHEVEVLLDGGLLRARCIRETPVGAQSLGLLDVLGLGEQDRWRVNVGVELGKAVAGWRALESEQEDLVGAGNAVGGVEAGFVVLIGDLESIQLLLVGVLAHAIVVAAKVKGRSVRAVEPETLASLGPLLQGETVRGELAEAIVVPDRNPVKPGGDSGVPSGLIGELLAGNLSSLDRGTRVTTLASNGLNSLVEEASINTSNADVAVVLLLSLQRDLELDTQTGDKVLVRVTIEDNAVDNADRIGVGIEVEANDEGEPVIVVGTLGGGVLATDGDKSTHRAVLAHGNLLDVALEVASGDSGINSGSRAIRDGVLRLENQLSVSADRLAASSCDGVDDVATTLAERNGDLAGVDRDLVAGFIDGQGGAFGALGAVLGSLGCCLDGVFVGDLVGMGKGVSTPLDGAVAPVAGNPGLRGDLFTGSAGDLEVGIILTIPALGPRNTEGGSEVLRRSVLNPLDFDTAGSAVGALR
ncbi:hypothetical protein HJFPF1_08079 [Paramyrothecium foliicola]|nr:hypothetical protein HJFPF1_08079 [Paramyrothecium foliicola]